MYFIWFLYSYRNVFLYLGTDFITRGYIKTERTIGAYSQLHPGLTKS